MKKISVIFSENFQFLLVKISIYLNRRVFVMLRANFFLTEQIPIQKGTKNILTELTPMKVYISSDHIDFVCVEVLRPSQPNGVMLSAVSLPNHTFTGQA